MYYSDDILDQLRSANAIVDVIGQDVKLKRAGSSYVGLCPFHNEKTPSFSVSGQKQMFYCFGCHKGGNVITYVEEYNNMGFLEAVEYLAQRAGIRLPQREVSAEEKRSMSERTRLLELNRLAGTYYLQPAVRGGQERDGLPDPKGPVGGDHESVRPRICAEDTVGRSVPFHEVQRDQ